MPINIALDGPVGAGKSSVADQVAERLQILHLDTGAMYRAIGLYMLEQGVDPQDEETVSRRCAEAEISVRYDGGQHTLLNGRDVSAEIRTPEASQAASAVSKWPEVRRRMVAQQQKLAREADMLIDGRDIGTVVLKDSPVKIYLTADAEERARRRWLQQKEKGEEQPFEEVLAELLARDEQDMNRKTDPLRVAEGATVVDSTHLTEKETVDEIVRLVEAHYGRR